MRSYIIICEPGGLTEQKVPISKFRLVVPCLHLELAVQLAPENFSNYIHLTVVKKLFESLSRVVFS